MIPKDKIKFWHENANPKHYKLALSVPISVLVQLPPEDQELFMKDPFAFAKKYPQFATKYARK